jgi:hypothetical protein
LVKDHTQANNDLKLHWTYSIFVAAFFALTVTEPGECSSVWAIDTFWLNRAAGRSGAGLNQCNMDEDKSGAYFRKPSWGARRRHERRRRSYRLRIRTA